MNRILKVGKLRIRIGRPIIGYWTGQADRLACRCCQPPRMPMGSPAGLTWRCECGHEFTWKPRL